MEKKNKTKIAVIRPGIHTLDEQFCLYLAKEEFDVTLIAPQKSYATPKKNIDKQLFKVVQLKSLNFKKLADFPIPLSLYSYLKNNNFDIIQSNEDFQFVTWVAALYARRNNKRFVLIQERYLYPRFTFHKYMFILFQKTISRFVWDTSSDIICHSKACLDFMKKNVNKNKKKLTFLPIGVNTELFYPTRVAKDKDNTLKIISIGRLVFHKNYELLLESIKNINEKKDLKVKLTIIGEGPLKNKLLDIIKTDKLDNVEIKSNMPFDKLKIEYSKNDLFILPSRIEMIGATITEAMACGLPIISSRVGGMPDYVVENKNGYIFESGNSHDLVKKIMQIKDKSKLKKFGQESYNLIKSVFDWNVVIKSYANILKQ